MGARGHVGEAERALLQTNNGGRLPVNEHERRAVAEVVVAHSKLEQHGRPILGGGGRIDDNLRFGRQNRAAQDNPNPMLGQPTVTVNGALALDRDLDGSAH